MSSQSTVAHPGAHDHASTLFLPRTPFPLRGDLPAREPDLLRRWRETALTERLRDAGVGRPRFVLHDGPPYANGHVHLGHALNKVLKDVVARSRRMEGWSSDLVPGWDCHGLPVEWKVEEECRAAGTPKEALAPVEFRSRCRTFAQGWLDVQRDEFMRLGVEADWDRPYTTMAFEAEATVAREALSLAASGMLRRGTRPVMWSVVEGTALAEAEVEYADVTRDAAHVAFPCRPVPGAASWNELAAPDGGGEPASLVCWTTTPWTLPGNRAVAYSPRASYGLHRVDAAEEAALVRVGALLVLSDAASGHALRAMGVSAAVRLRDVPVEALAFGSCAHPLAAAMPGYGFDVPVLPGGHVADDAGTGFVHTAPGHGKEDHDLWVASSAALAARGVDDRVPCVVGPDGFATHDAPGFAGRRVMDGAGAWGDMDHAVMEALGEAGTLLARRRHRHSYPHSWRSRKPVVFRATTQWFVPVDRPCAAAGGATLREAALAAAGTVSWHPPAARERMTGMLAGRPDWLVSRQRLWGVPLPLFTRSAGDGSVETLRDDAVDARVLAAFRVEGADAWFAAGASERFLGARAGEGWTKVADVLDVWFDSGSTHAFVLGDPGAFPAFAGLRRAVDGGPDVVMYLEGSDQHRGWFQSSLLESCATRGRAPYDVVLTHGFVLDDKGRKMAKGLGNGVSPQELVSAHGADVLRLWAASAAFTDDVRVGKAAMATASDAYRKLRNVLRWLLGTLAHRVEGDAPPLSEVPALDRLLLHRLAVVDREVRSAYAAFDLPRVVSTLLGFASSDLSAFHFEARKDVLYCDAPSSPRRRAALMALDHAFERMVLWLAPLLPFTAEEAWLTRKARGDGSVHLLRFLDTPDGWEDDALAARWDRARRVRRVVTGALEAERASGRLRASLEAHPVVHLSDPSALRDLDGLDMAEACVTSGLDLVEGPGPVTAFRLDDVPGVAVEPRRASGRKCARSWKVSPLVGTVEGHPDVTPRDAEALRELARR